MQVVQEHRNALAVATRYKLGQNPRTAACPVVYRGHTAFMPGGVTAVEQDAGLLAVETCQRIAPWCPLILTPRLLALCDGWPEAPVSTVETYDGQEWYPLSGRYIGATETIIVALSTPKALIRTSCHEAWHAIEKRLSPAWKAAIDADLAPLSWGLDHSYWTDSEERRARAFDTWCARLVEGMPARFFRTNLDEIFAQAWSGELGDALSRNKGKPEKVSAKMRISRLFGRKIP